MKNNYIIFVTAGKWQIKGIKTAIKLGFNIIAIDSDKKALGKKYANVFINEKLENHVRILKKLKKINNISGVLSYCSEAGMSLAAIIRKEFSLFGPNLKLTEFLINKSYQRAQIEKLNLQNPKWKCITKFNQIKNLNKFFIGKIIMKPVDSAGSRGVVKYSNLSLISKKDFDNSIKYSKRNKLIIENFIEGDEYTVETFSTKENLNILTITKKNKIKSKNFSVANELYNPKIPTKLYDKIHLTLNKIFNSIKYYYGPAHTEIIVNKKQKIFVVEVAGRGPGFDVFDEFIPKVSGINVPEITILQYTNNNYFIKKNNRKKYGRIKYFETKKGKVKKILNLKKINKSNQVYSKNFVKKGVYTQDPISDNDRLGYILCLSGNYKTSYVQMKKIVKKNYYEYY